MKYITVEGVKYRIRGPYTAKQLRTHYADFLRKYPGTTASLRGFLVGYGKVYNRVK